MLQIENHPDAGALEGDAFGRMGIAARAAFALTVRLEEIGAQALAQRLANLGDDHLSELRADLDAAEKCLKWASDLCATGREIVEATLSAND